MTSMPVLRAEGRRATCRHTRGRWCLQYPKNPDEVAKPPPRGSRECANNCSRVGNCNYDTGMCDCPAGVWGEEGRVWNR